MNIKTLVINDEIHRMIKMVSELEKKSLVEVTEELLLDSLQKKIQEIKRQQQKNKQESED